MELSRKNRRSRPTRLVSVFLLSLTILPAPRCADVLFAQDVLPAGDESGRASEALTRAHKLLQEGKLDLALEECDAALRIDPNALLAFVYERKQFDLALTDLSEAIRLQRGSPGGMKSEKKSTKILTCRGIIFQSQGQLDEALADFDEAIEIDRDHYEALRHRGEVREALATTKSDREKADPSTQPTATGREP